MPFSLEIPFGICAIIFPYSPISGSGSCWQTADTPGLEKSSEPSTMDLPKFLHHRVPEQLPPSECLWSKSYFPDDLAHAFRDVFLLSGASAQSWWQVGEELGLPWASATPCFHWLHPMLRPMLAPIWELTARERCSSWGQIEHLVSEASAAGGAVCHWAQLVPSASPRLLLSICPCILLFLNPSFPFIRQFIHLSFHSSLTVDGFWDARGPCEKLNRYQSCIPEEMAEPSSSSFPSIPSFFSSPFSFSFIDIIRAAPTDEPAPFWVTLVVVIDSYSRLKQTQVQKCPGTVLHSSSLSNVKNLKPKRSKTFNFFLLTWGHK